MFRTAGFQRTATWLVIGSYVILASGLPLPFGGMAGDSPAAKRLAGNSPAAKRLAGKDRSTPFPCMDKPCGCATAEQCFTSCCCHSPAETLAWARARGVEPAVIAALQRRVEVAPARAKPSCCAAKEPSGSGVSSCCAVSSAVAKSTNCREAPAAVPVGNGPAESSDEPVSGKSLSLRAMLACGGIVAEWFSCGGSLPPPRVALVIGRDLIETLPCLNESASPMRAAPDAPPPRVG